MTERFDEIRGKIAANDEAIVAAVNRRLELVAELWALKAHSASTPWTRSASGACASNSRIERRPPVGRRPRSARDRTARPDEARAARVDDAG